MALRSTQPLTEVSTMNLPGCKGRSGRKADNLTTIRKPIVYKASKSHHLRASTACYRDSFNFTLGRTEVLV
jgi:hypothetical protein